MNTRGYQCVGGVVHASLLPCTLTRNSRRVEPAYLAIFLLHPFPRCWILQVAFLRAANMPPYPLFSGHPNPNASGGDVLYMVSRQHASWYLVQSPTLWMREFLFFVHTQLIPTEPKTLAKVLSSACCQEARLKRGGPTRCETGSLRSTGASMAQLKWPTK